MIVDPYVWTVSISHVYAYFLGVRIYVTYFFYVVLCIIDAFNVSLEVT